MSDVMIEARNLTKTYGAVRAIDSVSFDVRKGEVLGFLGPNGAGKTTTMKILTCFIAPSNGTAKVNGCDVFEDSLGVRRAIGYLPESTPLYHEMLVLEYLEFVTRMRGLRGPGARARIKKVCEETGLITQIARPIGQLSKGFRQRVGLAQALVHEPPILILDEPMSGLDPNQAVEIRDLIRTIGRERTVILSTHNLAEVQVVCDRVLIIARGKIVADDKPQELVERAGKMRYVVTALRENDATPERVRQVLSGIRGVDRARPLDRELGDDGEFAFEVVPSNGGDLRPAIFRAAVDAGMVLVGLRREGQNLEQIFRQLTLDEPGPGEPGKDEPQQDRKEL